ncbi:MAG: hypothetical protein JXA69_06350, partial [Phycisphaerae bacterium]|nr:hypothetical protein [Phycisphaerae bacterium]
WLCEVSVDVPDRGGVRVSASIDAPLPEPPPVTVKVVVDEPLVFMPTTTPTGLTYARSSGRLEVHLTNVSSGTVIVSPTVRLLGEILPVASPSRPAWPITIDAGKTITLRMNPVLANAIEGPHYVQVAFAEDPLGRLHLHPVLIERGAAATQPAK